MQQVKQFNVVLLKYFFLLLLKKHARKTNDVGSLHIADKVFLFLANSFLLFYFLHPGDGPAHPEEPPLSLHSLADKWFQSFSCGSLAQKANSCISPKKKHTKKTFSLLSPRLVFTLCASPTSCRLKQ